MTSYSKKSILALSALILTATTLASMPRVDRIFLEDSWQYPLFYVSNLPLPYHISIAFLALLAIFYRDRNIQLLSVFLIALLISLTPSIMLENPWVPDQYPYMAEASILVKTHHISSFHHLDQTPGLALIFSQLKLVTDLGFFTLSDLYPLLIVLVTPLMFLTGEKICGNGAIPSLLFFGFSFHQPNVYHRNTLFLILFIVLLFLMVKSFGNRRIEWPIMYVIVASTLAITYPGTAVPIASLLSIATLFFILGGDHEVVKFGTTVSFATIFLSWYMFSAEWEFGHMVSLIYGGFQELIFPTTQRFLEITAYGESALTDIFQLLNNARIGFTLLLVGLATVASVHAFFKREKDPNIIFISYMFLTTGALFLLLMLFIFYGPPTFFKLHTFFVYLSALCASLLLKSLSKHKNKVNLSFGILALVSLLLVPLLSYSTIPFLHPPSSELEAKSFVDEHYTGKDPILATELNLPYYLSVLRGGEPVLEPKAILSPAEPIHRDSNYLILQRFATRDGYLVYPTGYREYLDLLINSLSTSHNLVYHSGSYTMVFMRSE